MLRLDQFVYENKLFITHSDDGSVAPCHAGTASFGFAEEQKCVLITVKHCLHILTANYHIHHMNYGFSWLKKET